MSESCPNSGCRLPTARPYRGIEQGMLPVWAGASGQRGGRVPYAGSGVVFNLARLLPPVEIHSASSGGASSSPPKKNSWCCHALYRSPISRSLPAACLDVAEVRGEHCRQPPTQPLFVITPSVTPSIVFTGVPPRIIIN